MSKTIKVIANVSNAASAYAGGQQGVDKAARAHMGNKRLGGRPYEIAHAEVSHSFLVGYLAGRLGVSEAKAALVLTKGKNGGTGQLAKGQSRRTKDEEAAYGAARTSLSRMLSRAGIVSPLQAKRDDNAGGKAQTGNRTKAGQGKAKAKAKNDNVVPIVKAKNREAAYQDLERMAATMLAYANKNAGVINGEIGQRVNAFKLELSSLIAGELK